MFANIRVRNADGTIVEIPALKGDPGEPYVLTEEDKTSIVDEVLEAIPIWEGGSY